MNDVYTSMANVEDADLMDELEKLDANQLKPEPKIEEKPMVAPTDEIENLEKRLAALEVDDQIPEVGEKGKIEERQAVIL